MDWLNNALLLAPPSATLESNALPSDLFPEQMWYAYSGQRSPSNTLYIWLHGWGQSYKAFLPLLQQLESLGDHLLVDFPGFGHSPPPPLSWGTEEYAHQLHHLIQRIATHTPRLILIGHSFGCRVSLQYVHHYPDQLNGMIFIAGAGLKRVLSLPQRTRRFLIKTTLHLAKKVDYLFPTQYADWVRQRFGSRDYLNAGILRPILSRVVNEDLTELARHTRVPVLLIYGKLDSQTPPEFGTRYHALMPRSTLHIVPDVDHDTVLTHAKYHLKRFISDWVSAS